jgi:hypothetical protein
MRLSNSPRALAALSFLWPSIISIGVLVILGNQLGSVSALFSLEPPADTIVRFTCIALLIALVCGGLLLSPVMLPRFARWSMLFVCVGITLGCLGFAQLLSLGWVFPCWYLFRFAHETYA